MYEVIWGQALDKRNFYRKVKKLSGLIAPTGRKTSGRSGRPAELYVLMEGAESGHLSLRLDRSGAQQSLTDL